MRRSGHLRGILVPAIVTVVVVALILAGWPVMRAQKEAFELETAAVIHLEDDLGAPVRVVRFTGLSPYKHVDMIGIPARTYTEDDFRAIVVCLKSLPHCDTVEAANADLTQEEIRTFKSVLPNNVMLADGVFYVDGTGSRPPAWERVDRR